MSGCRTRRLGGIIRASLEGVKRCASVATVSAANPPAALEPELGLWLRRQDCREETLQALAGDVSLRRYFRLRCGGATAILARYPLEIADALTRFQASSALLAGAGVRVPRIFAADVGLGAMLLEDLGERTLYDLPPDWPELRGFFREALATLDRLRSIEPRLVAPLNPPLDAALLERELGKTRDSFLLPRGLLASPEETAAWDCFARAIAERLAGDEPVPCHRDFMARNLVPLAGHGLAVLDHQDLRPGPPGYDLASLLNDSLFPPPELEEELLAEAGWQAGERRAAYRRAAVQRGFKAVGTFASFALRGATRHLRLVAPTGARALSQLEELPERELLPAAIRDRLAAAFC
jgi:aminoglycoside/choline kinase family phosphotransferase